MKKLLAMLAATTLVFSTSLFASGGSNAPYGEASNQTASDQYIDCLLEDGTRKVIPVRSCERLGGKEIY
ncbi:hypothetical protein ACP3V5_05365 [Vibrio maritimus]|jgi:hypothetical protein